MEPLIAPSRAFRTVSPFLWGMGLLVLLYLSGWLSLGIYPDEVALRINAARGDADHWVQWGLFGFCPSNSKPFPWSLHPAAWAFAQFDQHVGWHAIRALPLLLLTAWSVAIATTATRGWQRFLLCGAFVGASGAGIMLVRPEFFGLLLLLVSFLTFAAAKRRPAAPWLILALVLLHLFVLSVALLVHVQHVLLVPLSLLSLWRLLQPRPVLATMVTLMVALLTYQTLQLWHFRCDERPEFAAMMAKNQGSATPHFDSPDRLQRYAQRGMTYMRHSAYKLYFNPGHVPGVDAWPARALNPAIMLVIAGNALAVFAVLLAGLRQLWRHYRHRLAPAQWRATWHALLWDPWVALTGSAALLLTYGIYDIGGTFYRALTINLLAASLIAIAAAHVQERWLKRGLGALGALALATCIASTLANYTYITPGLMRGHAGPSIPSTQDWAQTAQQVEALKKGCHVKPDTLRVVGDDLTYRFLRLQPQLLHLVYLYTDEVVMRGRYDEATARQRLEKLRRADTGPVMARCKTFELFQLPHTAQRGELCCLEP